jgi:hypothetical protein
MRSINGRHLRATHPHLLHVPALAKLAGIEPPKGLLPAPAVTGAESDLEAVKSPQCLDLLKAVF